jgi:hypothetical protein
VDWTAFTHQGLEAWDQLYPYTVIAYRLGKRITREFPYAEDAFDSCHSDDYAVSHVVTPNGEVWDRSDFIRQYEKITGVYHRSGS